MPTTTLPHAPPLLPPRLALVPKCASVSLENRLGRLADWWPLTPRAVLLEQEALWEIVVAVFVHKSLLDYVSNVQVNPPKP